MMHPTTAVLGLTCLAISALVLMAVFGVPKFIDNWMIRQNYDGEAATKNLVRQLAKGQIAAAEFDRVFEDIQKVFGEKMKEVERSIRLHDSIDARRARVARRRPLQRKLGRIA